MRHYSLNSNIRQTMVGTTQIVLSPTAIRIIHSIHSACIVF